VRAGSTGEGNVVRGKGEWLANCFVVEKCGCEVNGVQRSKNGWKRLCRPLEDLPARIDQRQAVEEDEST